MLGPFFYSEEKETQKTWAVPPLLSHTQDPATDSEEFDFAYPVLTYDRYGDEYRWQFCQLLSFAGGRNPDQTDQQTRRFTLFPLYFQQRSPDTERELHRAPSVLWPSQTPAASGRNVLRDVSHLHARRAKKDVVTDNYLYPVFPSAPRRRTRRLAILASRRSRAQRRDHSDK